MTPAQDLEIPIVAADHFGIWGSDGASVSVHHNHHQILVHLHRNISHALIRQEKDNSKESHLKLRADANETTAHRLDQTVPAELQVQDVIVLIRLGILTTEISINFNEF